jgi:O-antigen/teichoic acid export membrane protein
MTRLASQVISQWMATALVGAATLILQIVMARQLGPFTFGLYGTVAAIGSILVIVQDGGFRSLLYREATHQTAGFPPNQTLLSYALGWNLAATVVALLLCGAAATTDATLSLTLAIVIVANLGRVTTINISSLMRAAGRFVDEARWQVTSRLLTALSMIAVAFMTGNLIKVLIAGAIAQFILLTLPMARLGLSTPRFTIRKIVLRTCVTLVAVDLVTALYFRSDVLILAAFGYARDDIGVYVAMTRSVEAVVFFSAPVAVMFFRSARLVASDTKLLARRIWLLTALFEVPLVAVLALCASYGDYLIELVYGQAYRSGNAYLPWLIAACFAVVPNALLGQALLARNREGYFLAATVGALIVNLVANFTLVPSRGVFGAAQSTVATEYSLLVLLTVAFYVRSGRASAAATTAR